MATRLQYRTSLKDKLTALIDSDAADFDFSDTEYNIYLELAVARLFPSVYARKSQLGLATTQYGTKWGMARVSGVIKPERVYMVEDAAERTPIAGWQARPNSGEILGIPADISAVNVLYFDAVTLPSNDVTDVGIGDEYLPLVIQGALIEALETIQEIPARNTQMAMPTMSSILDRVIARYNRLKDDMSMSLPVVSL
jgi:hypothetical protein